MKKLPVLLLFFLFTSLPSYAQLAQPPGPEEVALMEAAFNGNLAKTRELVMNGTSVDAADGENRTVTMWAAFNGHTAIIQLLKEKGANINAIDTNGRTALLYASSGPYPETVEYLLKNGADINAQGTAEGFTALMTAAAEGQLEIVRLLLVHGADQTLTDKDGDTAESFARQNGHSSVIAMLESPPDVQPGS